MIVRYDTVPVGGQPLDIISLGQPDPNGPGTFDSDYLQWVGRSHDGNQIHLAHWRIHVDVTDQTGASKLVIEARRDGAGYAKKVEVSGSGGLTAHGGDVEVASPGNGVVLRSPNGKRWRVTVDDEGRLETTSIVRD
jgi:hypothetical protein